MMLDVGELAALLVRRATDLGVDFDVADGDRFLACNRFENQSPLPALDRFGSEVLADAPPVEIRFFDVDTLRRQEPRVILKRFSEFLFDERLRHIEVVRGDERVANLIPLRAQYFELAVTADVIRDGLAHLSDALPPADALRKL